MQGLTSLVFFLSFSALSTFFVLNDSRIMRAFINRHLGVPVRLARNIASALRGYFDRRCVLCRLDVPLASTIAVVTV